MATRRPDGVPGGGKFEEEPDAGPALARPATDAADMAKALGKNESFPSGMKALAELEGRGATEATICNLSLKKVQFDRVHGPQPDGKKGIVAVTLAPFETITVPLDEAKRILAHQELAPLPKPGKRSKRPRPTLVVVGVFPGSCDGKRKFTSGGKTFRTCPFHGCEFADHGERPFSVWQAHHFLRDLRTPEAIDRFAETFDLRVDVTNLAAFERKRREEMNRLERMQAAKSAGALEAVN